ncbi:MAG: SDR family oxidoreductase [Chloroflexi bacterium]|nr:SDR family oxidoreductase [Chloroflexota bacterium]
MMDTSELYASIRPRYPEFKDHVALVTGSGLGIGKAIALRLAREGMRLVIHGKEEADVAQTVREFEALGVDTLGVCTDFSQSDGVDHLFDVLRQRHTRLDVLVNNAADLRRTDLDHATTEMFDYQLEVNLRAPYLCSVQAAAMMRPAKTGAIINISSVGAQRAHWRGLPYDLTKGALESMTRVMAINLASEGIRVNAIAPGAILRRQTAAANAEKTREIAGRIPMGRLGSDLEVGAAVAFLASEDASYVTGHVLFVDGGITAQISPPGQPI